MNTQDNEAKLTLVDDKGEAVESTIPLKSKVFKTGNRGLHGYSRIDIPSGKSYTVTILVVEVGSKKK